MVTAPRPVDLNGDRLRDDLAAAGIRVAWNEWSDVDGVLVFPTLAEKDQAVVRQVVGAHTGAPTSKEVVRRTNRQGLETAVGVLDRLANGKTVASDTKDRATLAEVNAGLSALAAIVRRNLRVTHGIGADRSD